MKINTIIILTTLITMVYSCKKGHEVPTGGNKILIGITTPDTVSYVFAKVSTQLNGTGGNQITQHGHCWSVEANPDIGDAHTSIGSITKPGKFMSDLSGLSDNLKYFIRPYFTFNDVTIYGSQIEINTMKRGKPVAITGVTSDITTSSAKISGVATFDSGFAITQKGICWDTLANPTLLKSIGHSEEGADTGSFISTINNLTENKQYYFSAYATNEKGTSYGVIKQFITVPIVKPTVLTSNVTEITNTSAKCGGNVTNAGNGTVTNRGVCWSTSPDPTTANSHTTDGTGIGVFVSNLTNLTQSTKYYVRAYAMNEAGTSYGNEVTFTALSLPKVTTYLVTNITQTTATSGGNVSSDGGYNVFARGVCWSTSSNPTTTNSHTTDGSGTGSYVSNLIGLSQNTVYYVRAYATSSAGTAYGNEVSFSTLENQKPTVITTTATNITQTTATSGGNVTSDGGATVTARGVCWSTSSNPTTTNSHTSDGSGTGIFVSNISGLNANTLYHLRAYATNSIATAYGNEITFTTTWYYIGQNYGGGIIFYIDGTGQHGLIAATSDQSTGAPWGCYGTMIGGTSTAIGAGQANTTAIVNGCGQGGIAARICNDLVLNGYSDWFLPSKDELNQMYLRKSVIGGFAYNYYWSSSEYSANNAWYQIFIYGLQDYAIKINTYYVRAIRTF